jgi:hypothetical protein
MVWNPAATVWHWMMNSSVPMGAGSAWSFSKTVWSEKATQQASHLKMLFAEHDADVML